MLFAAYKQFCEDTTVEKKRAIEEANEQIDVLKADMEKYIPTATKQIDVLKADMEKYIATATKLSKKIVEHEEGISVGWALHGSCARHHQDRCELPRRCHHGRTSRHCWSS